MIFFDEIDALCPKRVNMDNGASRVVNQLLTEMDGMEARPGVFLMAATNRPDIGELIVPIHKYKMKKQQRWYLIFWGLVIAYVQFLLFY